jgi:hypothetical protein
METKELFSLFGYSEYSPEIKSFFKKMNIKMTEPMSVCWKYFGSKKWDMELVFKAKNNFNHDYGPFKKAYKKSYEECFLEQISFGNQDGKTNYPFPLPFDLSFSDMPEALKQKLPLKTSKLSEAGYGSYFEFNSEDYQFVAGFDKKNKLTWIRVRPLELSFKKKRALKRTLKTQEITSMHSKKLVELKSSTPGIKWTKRMKKGDSIFTENNIADIVATLHEFIDNLIAAVKQKKASGVHSAVKKIVLRINKLNDKHEGFIDTMEREELADYIHKAVKLTGFRIEKGVDLTEEWREW